MPHQEKVKHICTYFDFNFLSRGLALINSVRRHNSGVRLYVLAFDDATFNYLSGLNISDLIIISSDTYNRFFNTGPKKYEDLKQYFFSSTPNICLYVFEKYPEVNELLYLDADMYVFDSLDSLYDEIGEASIAFCSHRFHPLFNLLSKNYGRYNVGVNYFRRSEMGLKCLNEWKNDCDNWYQGKPGYPLKFFSDQIFLDTWPEKYNEVKIIDNVGVDAAPWNVANYKFSVYDGKFIIDKSPLVIFHFSALKKTSENTWNGNTIYFFGSIKGVLLNIYLSYISELESCGLTNMKIATITHKNGTLKKIFYFWMKFFLNEKIIYRDRDAYGTH
jgi:hypothetical protein